MANEEPLYRRFVSQQPCAVCGAPPPSDPHHLPRWHGGRRAHDRTCIPCCRQCHNDVQHPNSLKGKFEGRTRKWYTEWHQTEAGKFYDRYREYRDDFAGDVVAEVTLRRRPNSEPF
jgi:hypothetical protein